jgi:eukaryotic-like serine/threonine-protein kinase
MAEDYFGIVGTTQAGAYRVEAVVAEGGFGVVYRAYHDAFQAPAALKCLKIPIQLDDKHQKEFLDNFKEEAALLFRLSSSIPAVVRPLHVDRLTLAANDPRFVPFMAMEWLEGEGFDALIQRRADEGLPPLGLKKVVRMLSPVARALARAHHFPGPDGPVSIVHRDLKPDNIFIAQVNGEELVKIFDFGIAKARSVATQVAGRLSQSGAMAAFTPGYGAPEQWLPKRFGQTGPWTDVFGLALTVLEGAAGRPIIDGDTAGMMGTAIDEQRRPTPRNEGLEVSDAVEAAFMAALAVDPRNRFPDAGQFWDALESALGIELTATPTLGGATRARSSSDDDDAPVSARAQMRISGRGQTDKNSPTLAAVDDDPAASRRGLPSRSGSEMLEFSAAGPSADIELDLGPPSRGGPRAATPAPSRPSRGDASGSGRFPPPASTRSGRPSNDLVAPPAPNVDIPLDVGAPKRGSGADLGARAPSDARPRVGSASMSGNFARVQMNETGSYPRPAAARAGIPEREPTSVLSRIKGPLTLAGGGMVLSVLDQAVLHATNSSIAVGPVRLAYLGAALTVVGVVILLKRLIVPE